MTTGLIAAAGDLDALFKARTSAKIADVGFLSNGGVDISNRFEPRGSTTARANTNFKSGANDLATLFMDIAASAFTPVTNTYNTGTGLTETVPAGATSCVIKCWGGGGGGSRIASDTGFGGGGGGYCTRTVAVTGGQTFTYTVGPGGAGRTSSSGAGTFGTTSTVSSASPSVSMSANFGQGGQVSIGGSGGTATGGTTNTTGGGGAQPQSGSSPNGGASGSGVGNAPGGGGAGGPGANSNGFTAAAGRVSFAYT